jgi:hypothetical protein
LAINISNMGNLDSASRLKLALDKGKKW